MIAITATDAAHLRTLAASLERATFDRQAATIGGGHFTSQELAHINAAIRRAIAMRVDLAHVEMAQDALKEALPWLILAGDKLGNGTPEDPQGRCRAVLKVRAALEALR